MDARSRLASQTSAQTELQRRNTTLLYVAAPAAAATPGSQAVGGYILYTTSGLVAHISKLMVDPALRRRGLGRALVGEAVALAQRERRVGSVTLHVDGGNDAALGLYRSLGFTSEAVLPDYYGAGRSAHKMRLQLTDDY